MTASLDVLCTHNHLDDLLVSNAVDVPVVYEYHGLQSVGLGSALRERLTATRHHLANAEPTADEVETRLGRSVDGVVTPGIDLDQFSPASPPASDVGFDADRPVVLFVGRLVRSKGVYDLLEAFRTVAPDAQLVLVGKGERSALERRVEELGLTASVAFAGEVPHERLPGYFTACDVVCYPSHYETFGLVNVEAMACGAPVITTALPGVEAYATHGETALLVEPEDVAGLARELERLLDSPALRERLGDAGRAIAGRYAWERQAAALASFCADLVDDERPVTPASPAAAGR